MAHYSNTNGAVKTKTHHNRHTAQVRRKQFFGKSILWIAAGITMFALVLIVGYIIVNGFYTRSIRAYPVLPYTENEIVMDADSPLKLSVVAHPSLRLDSVSYDELKELFQGLKPFLGYLTGQNRNARLYVYKNPSFTGYAEEYVLGEGNSFGKTIAFVASEEDLFNRVKNEKGAIALVPSEWLSRAGRLTIVGIRQMSAVVHPDITELQAGQRLGYLDRDQIEELFTEPESVWSDVGGPSIEIDPADLSAGYEGVYAPLPVQPVLFESDISVQGENIPGILPDGSLPDDVIYVDSVSRFEEAVSGTPGAVGIIRRREGLTLNLPALEVNRVTRSLNLRPSFFVTPPSRAGAVGGISYIIINTLAMVLFVLLIATPIGVAAAVYFVEYAKQGRLFNILRIGVDTLAAVPSIIFGLFGLVVFSQLLGFKTGLVSGTLTITLMILPTIINAGIEALKAVPHELREGSLALGATKLQTIAKVVIPTASPGILTGVILGIGRAIGETAALLFTMGSNLALIRGLNAPIRVMSVHLYMLIRENISIPNAFATATILVIIVFLVNYTTRRLIGRMNKKPGSDQTGDVGSVNPVKNMVFCFRGRYHEPVPDQPVADQLFCRCRPVPELYRGREESLYVSAFHQPSDFPAGTANRSSAV